MNEVKHPKPAALISICKSLTARAIGELSGASKGAAARASVHLGELRERLRQLESDAWAEANAEPVPIVSPQAPSERATDTGERQ